MESCFWTNGLDDSILWSRETGESGKVIEIQTFLKTSESESEKKSEIFTNSLNIGAQVTENQVKSDFHRLSLHCITRKIMRWRLML